jgi:uncharacterized membrane protein
MRSLGLLVHLVSFAAYLGAGFAQLRMMKRSMNAGLPVAVRDDYERLAATIVTKIELPALIGSVVSGIWFLVIFPGYLKLGWVHAKLACVLFLAVLSHLEMFNARAIVKERAAGGEHMEDNVLTRKNRHALFGSFGTALVLVLLVLVTFVKNGFG